jgi:hypothetical protein
VADVIALRVATAREIGAEGGAYRALAGAYGAFLLVQDSPRAAATLNQAFVEAATALVDGETQTLGDTLLAIEADVVALGEAARERRTSVPAGATAEVVAQPAELPSLPEAPAADGEAAAPADAPAVEAAELTLVDVEALRLQFQEAQLRERLDRLEADLAALGVPEAARPARAEALLTAGYERVSGVIDGFAASASAVVSAAHRGDDAAARAALGAASVLYEVHLSPIVRSVNATTDLDTLELLGRLGAVLGLRVQDAVVLNGQAEAVRHALAGVEPSAIQDGARRTATIWSGIVRVVVMLTIAILALIPLFLLNLAFGGGNRNWQLIGVALFLLLVPVLFEGLAALATLLVAYAGFDFLATVSAFSMFGSIVGQTVWAGLTLLAVLFAMMGLYGISAQFGLVGRRPVAPATSRSTRASRATTTETVDWDDDV